MELADVWAGVTPEDALQGSRFQSFQEKISFSDKAAAICEEQKDQAKSIELITPLPWDQSSFFKSNEDMLDKMKDGGGPVADFVKVAKITDHDHPAFLQANLLKDQDQKTPGYSLFVNKAVEKGTIIGALVGNVVIAHEGDDIVSNAQRGEDRLRELYFFDLEGSLESCGGWVKGNRLDQTQNILLLDASEKTNILTFLTDVRKDPYKTCSPPLSGNRGSSNVKFVEVRVNNIPRILVVATVDIKNREELLLDQGASYHTASLNIYLASKQLSVLQKLANEMADKYEQLRDEHQPVITKGIQDNRTVKMTRNVAVDMCKEWEEAISDDENEDFEPITKEDAGSIIATHVVGSLRKKVYEDQYGEEGEDKVASAMSEHQKLIYDDLFIPKKAKEVEIRGEKKTVWVDDPDCKKYVEIQAEHGTEIFQEVGRAWLEVQNLGDLTSGAQVPWNPMKRCVLENDEVVMRLTAKIMELTGKKPSDPDPSQGNAESQKRKRKFLQIYKDVRATTESETADEGALRAARQKGG